MNKSTGIKRSLIALIGRRGIDSNIARHVRTSAENCFWCGASIVGQKGVNGAHADHVVPRVKGGGDNVANLVPACSEGNRRKRSKDPIQFVPAVQKKLRYSTSIRIASTLSFFAASTSE